MDMLALIALFTGAFLIFSSQVLALLRRRPQLALLRAMGLTRAEVAGYLVAEGAAVGIVGAAIGLAAGYGLARGFGLPLTQVITITFEVGVQNLALSVAITFNILQRPDLAIAGLIYAAIMPATALMFVSIARRLLDRQRAESV